MSVLNSTRGYIPLKTYAAFFSEEIFIVMTRQQNYQYTLGIQIDVIGMFSTFEFSCERSILLELAN